MKERKERDYNIVSNSAWVSSLLASPPGLESASPSITLANSSPSLPVTWLNKTIPFNTNFVKLQVLTKDLFIKAFSLKESCLQFFPTIPSKKKHILGYIWKFTLFAVIYFIQNLSEVEMNCCQKWGEKKGNKW